MTEEERLWREHLKDWRETIEQKIDMLVQYQAANQELLTLLRKREQDNAELRKAIIEKSLLAAMCAVAVFVGQAMWHEVLRHLPGKP